MPSDLTSVSALVCQQVLKDQDGLISAIRIFEVITVRRIPTADSAILECSVVVLMKSSATKPSQRKMTVELVYPCGESRDLGGDEVNFGADGPDTEIGATMVLEFSLAIKISGLYRIIINLEGERIAAIPLTLRIETVQVL